MLSFPSAPLDAPGNDHLAGLIGRLALAYRDKPALLDDDGAALSYAALDQAVQANMAALRGFGVGPGSRVATVLPQGMEMLIGFLSVASSGVFAPLNPDSTRAEFEYYLNDLDADFLLTRAGLDTRARDAARTLGIPVLESGGVTDGAMTFADCPAGDGVAHHDPDPADVAVMLQTSGTTSTPKTVPLSHANLLAASGNVALSLALTDSDCCLNMLPPFHIGALVDLLLAPLSAGGSVAVAPDSAPETVFAALHRHRPTWLQAVPTMLAGLLNHDGETARAFFGKPAAGRLRFIRSVSAALPQTLGEEGRTRFGVPVIEIYGMTETAGVICSNPLDRPKPGSVGKPVGQQVAVRDGQGNFAAAGRSGEVIVRGANVFSGYRGESGRDAFIGDWFRTGDEGWFDDDGYLFLSGRIKEIINRGGEKVSPLEVEQVALACGGIEDAAAFAARHDTLGEDVALAVVAGSGAPDDRALREFLARHLTRHKVPRRIVRVERIPRNKSGKIVRAALSERHGGLRPDAKPRALPETEPARTLAAMWRDVLKVPAVGLNDDFFELGGDSLTALGFMNAVKEKYRCRVHVTALFEHPTLEEFAAYLEGLQDDAGAVPVPAISVPGLPEAITEVLGGYLSAWRGERRGPDSLVVGLNRLGDKPPLFWSVQAFNELRALADALGPAQPLYGMRSLADIPGKHEGHTGPLAKVYARELMAIQPIGDFYLGGFCEGARFAFETANELIASGRNVALLCLHDKFVAKPYMGRMALFFCKPTMSNPYGEFHEPEKGWYQFYKGSVSNYRLEMEHSYWDPRFPEFVSALTAELDAAIRGETSGRVIDLASRASRELPPAAYRADITLLGDAPKYVSPGASLDLRVAVRNAGEATWPPTRESGLVLANRWYNKRGVARSNADGRAELAEPVRPGETVELSLRVTAPNKSGYRVLVIDMADEGVTWFADAGSTALRLRMRALPGGSWINRLF